MSICNGTFSPLQRTEPYASSSVYSDSQQSGENSFNSSEQPESRSTSLTDPEDVSSKDASSIKCEGVNPNQSKAAEATSVNRQALAVNSSDSPCSSAPVLGRQSESKSPSDCEDSAGALRRPMNGHEPYGASKSQSKNARSTSKSPEVSRSARIVAQSSSTRGRLPARATGVHSPIRMSNVNKVAKPEGSIVVKTRIPAPAIRHARRDMQFNLPCAARPDVREEMNRARLRISGGSIEKTTRTNAHLRQLLGTVSNHKNLHLNQQTLLDLSSVLDLPAPTNQQEYEMLRALIGTAQKAMRHYNVESHDPPYDKSHIRRPGALGEMKNSYSEVKAKAGLVDLKPKVGYFSHRSIPDIRMPSTDTGDKAQRTSRLSYSYRGPLDLTFASREPLHERLPPGRASFVDSDEMRTVSGLDRVGSFSDDFLLLETQLVPSGSISSARESRRRRWSISESRSLAFSYKLASSKNASSGGPSRTVAPIPTPSLASVPSMPDLLPARSSATRTIPSPSPVYRGESSWRDSKLGFQAPRWGVRTPSVKSTATDYWNNVYSNNPAITIPAHLARPSMGGEVAERSTHENVTTDVIDWAQLVRTPSLASESGHSKFSFTPSQAREWARHPRIEDQSAERTSAPHESRERTSKSTHSPKTASGRRRLFTHRPFSRPDDTRVTANNAQADDEALQPSRSEAEQIDDGADVDDPEIEVIPRELPNPHERPMSYVSSVYIDRMFQMAGGSLAPGQQFEDNQQRGMPTRTSSIRSWWSGMLDRP